MSRYVELRDMGFTDSQSLQIISREKREKEFKITKEMAEVAFQSKNENPIDFINKNFNLIKNY